MKDKHFDYTRQYLTKNIHSSYVSIFDDFYYPLFYNLILKKILCSHSLDSALRLRASTTDFRKPIVLNINSDPNIAFPSREKWERSEVKRGAGNIIYTVGHKLNARLEAMSFQQN